ncbi:DUF2591 domain-containing protein [Pantoea piersonii]|uniref:DUF2591 domain-containing protein n=1 Tax=Pantoea piersonii TaxID=2364647 RepID=A0AAJ5QIB2_9GAMM|nr:phage protein NinX family protein [Pantoea piersonii]WBG90043.1 DUF2591 domain-containing protein [Pantoea piersonii]
MNYSEMSDFEINCAVARALGMSHAFFFSKSEDDFCEGIEPNKRGPIWQSGKYMVNGYRVSNGNCFNPCNSWADAGPIIKDHQICLSFDREREDYAWSAGYNGHDDYELSGEWLEFSDANPLRAAMTVFLMTQEKPDAA